VLVVDTNVLVYAANRGAPEHERCRALVVGLCSQATPWYLTWSIAYDFLRVVTHPRVFRAPWSPADAWRFLEVLLAAPGLGMLVEGERHAEILASLVAGVPRLAGNLLHDAHTAALMREHGVRTIYTRDTDFHRFAELEVRDPLR
jgi:toxin-antitoxin system PIN domain toxin